jgi:hypothetical protein
VASVDPLYDLLYQAQASGLGIVCEVEDFVKATQALYSARRKLCDPLLENLQFRRSPLRPDNEVWIVNLTPELAVSVALNEPPKDPPSNA